MLVNELSPGAKMASAPVCTQVNTIPENDTPPIDAQALGSSN